MTTQPTPLQPRPLVTVYHRGTSRERREVTGIMLYPVERRGRVYWVTIPTDDHPERAR